MLKISAFYLDKQKSFVPNAMKLCNSCNMMFDVSNYQYIVNPSLWISRQKRIPKGAHETHHHNDASWDWYHLQPFTDLYRNFRSVYLQVCYRIGHSRMFLVFCLPCYSNSIALFLEILDAHPKGQIISEQIYDFFRFFQITNKNIWWVSAVEGHLG